MIKPYPIITALTLATLTSLAHASEAAKTDNLIGQYACSFTQMIDNQPYTYPAFKCKISQKGEQLELEKLSGSQRIKGLLLPDADGWRFEGTYFCPWGDCTEATAGHFEKIKEGVYKGTIYTPSTQNDPTVVDLTKTR